MLVSALFTYLRLACILASVIVIRHFGMLVASLISQVLSSVFTSLEDKHVVAVKFLQRNAGNMSSDWTILENERGQLHVVKVWRFPVRMHSKTSLPSSTRSSKCL